jgi:fused signal recognition particle receptor
MNWFSKLTSGLKKTSTGITEIFTKEKLDEATLEELEELLILSDMGVGTATAITEEIGRQRHEKDLSGEALRDMLAHAIATRLEPYALPLKTEGSTPRVVLVVGVNGNGKTTTIGKLAHQLRGEGKKVALVAGDTFRAAAVEQLKVWADRAGAIFHAGAANADPASVAYQGLEAAIKAGADVVFIDTAGRLHNQDNLMAELAKITKVIRKLVPDAPHDVLQVLDATTGQNALAQLKAFKDVAGVTGIIVTKLDGTAKAGVVLALAQEFKLPIHAIGVGEGADDLQPFTAQDFARALVGLAA